jgi:hypothetical protein
MKNFAKYLARESKYLYNTDLKSVLTWLYDLFDKVDAENKRPRDPRPLINLNGIMGGHYHFSRLHFALVSEDCRILNGTLHCRDYLNEVIRWWVTAGQTHSFHCKDDIEGRLDRKYLRLLLLLDTNGHVWDRENNDVSPYSGIKNGVRVANMYGRVAGWSPIDLIRCKFSADPEVEREAYLLVGDRNWQRAPEFISMLTLLIRICLAYEVPKWITDAYALTGYWHELLYHTEHFPRGDDFTSFLAHSYHHMLLLMAHERELFPGSMEENFSPKGTNFHPKSGLDSLVRDDSFHPVAAKKLKSYYDMEVLRYGAKK